MLCLGVDLKTSTKRPSAVSVIDDDARVVFIGSFLDDSGLFEIVEKYPPARIAIGTPLGLPEGLCCLEPTCDCKLATPQKKGRQSELELARMGISCFFTNKGSIIRNLIYRAVRLSQQLDAMGLHTVEVYPHATKVILFGDTVPPKNSPRSLPFMKEELPSLVAGLDSYLDKLDRSACDSLINAHTARLHFNDETDRVGTEQEGFIAIPKLIRLEASQ